MAAVERTFSRCVGALPQHTARVVVLSGAMSFVGMYCASRDPHMALLAMAMGQVASLVDSCVRGIFDGLLANQDWQVTISYLAIKLGLSMGAAVVLTSTLGFSSFFLKPVMAKIGGYIVVNAAMTGALHFFGVKIATPYSIGA